MEKQENMQIIVQSVIIGDILLPQPNMRMEKREDFYIVIIVKSHIV